MTLSAFVAFMVGANLELVLLWQDSRHPEENATRSGIVAPGLSRAQWVMAAVAAAGVILISFFEVVGLGSRQVSLADGWMGMIFVWYGVFIFFAGLWGNLLPRVNEKSILAVQALVAVGLLSSSEVLDPWLVACWVGLPAVVMLYLVIRRTPLRPIPKAIVYLWYLFSLLALSFENGSAELFRQSNFDVFEGFTFGATFIFLILHGLFSIRFFLMVSSLILPRNRPYIGYVMPHLFEDEQIEPRQFFAMLALIVVLLLVNNLISFLPATTLLNVSVLACVQFLFRSPNVASGEVRVISKSIRR